jgi:hypothetical protein
LEQPTFRQFSSGLIEGFPMTWWQTDVPLNKQTPVKVGRLSFDPQNPRFTPDKSPAGRTDAAIVTHMARSADLGELVDSISASGYIDIEPLIVIGEGESLVVLEGNRRLAALRVIVDPDLARHAKIVVPDMTPAHRATTERASVYRVARREDARDLIGFKHINGPQPWDALAKARFAANWLDAENTRRKEGAADALTLADITQRMGDKHDTIFRIVSASYALDQAERDGLFSVSDRAARNFSFSHLYTALTYSEIREFIGMEPASRSVEPQHNPVPSTHYEQYEKLLLWLYGSSSKGIAPIIRTQAKDLGRLKRAIGHPKALPMLIAHGDLDVAVQEATPGTVRLSENLLIAKAHLERAQSVLQLFDGEDEQIVSTAEEINKSAGFIHRNIKATFEEATAKRAPESSKKGE